MLWSGLCSKNVLWEAPLIGFIIAFTFNAVHMGSQMCLERGRPGYEDG